MVDGEILQVIADAGGHLEYYDSDDPHWSKPEALKVDAGASGLAGAVLPISDDVQPNPNLRPATLDEVVRNFRPKEYQRVLQGTDDAGNVTYYVVNALYRSPWDRTEEGDLKELPPELPITLAEMEVLGPWLELDEDEIVSAVRPSTMDTDLSDGRDYVFATKYDWSSYDSVKDLRDHLLNLLKVKSGKGPNINGWSTDIDETRLGFLLGFVEARYQDLRVQSGRYTDGEKLWDGTLTGTGFVIPTVVIGALAYIVGRAAAKGKLLPGVLKFLAMLKASGGWLWNAFLHVITTPKLLGDKKVLRFLWNYGGPAVAAVLGCIVGSKVVETGVRGYFRKDGEDDPDAELVLYAHDEGLMQGFADLWGLRPVGPAKSAVKGAYYAFFLSYAQLSDADDEAMQGKIKSLIRKSDEFGDFMTDRLVAYMNRSIEEKNQQIDWNAIQQEVSAFYRQHKEYIDENYELLDYTAHRSTKGKKIRDMIAADGTIINRDVMREYLKKTVEDRLRDKTQQLIHMALHRGLRVTMEGTEVKVHSFGPYTVVQQAYINGLNGDDSGFKSIDDVGKGFAAGLARKINKLRWHLHSLNGGGITPKPVAAKESDEPADEELLKELLSTD